jgi:hypothetical protein
MKREARLSAKRATIRPMTKSGIPIEPAKTVGGRARAASRLT